MADHEFYGTVSASDAATASDHLIRKGEHDADLTGKANTSHTHAIGDLPVATSGTSNATQLVRADDLRLSNARTPTAHNHAIADVTNLQTTLDGKAATSHTHTASQVTDLQAFVDGRIGVVVDGAPGTLDTLNELAAALGDDPNFATTIAGQLSALDTRLDALEANAGTGVFRQTHGDGSAKIFTITHNLGTTDVDVIVRRLSDGQRVYPVDKATGTNAVSIDYGSFTPPTSSFRALVVKT